MFFLFREFLWFSGALLVFHGLGIRSCSFHREELIAVCRSALDVIRLVILERQPQRSLKDLREDIHQALIQTR